MVRLFENFGPSRDEIEKQEGNTRCDVTGIDFLHNPFV